MDLANKVIAAYLICIAIMRMTEAGCKDDIESNDEYMECMTGYQTFMANLNSGGSSQDGNVMIAAFCGPQGKAARACLDPFVDRCEELKTNPMLSFYTVTEQMGGCKNAPQSGNAGNTVCATARQTCSTMSGAHTSEESDMEGAATEFNKFQEQIKTICGGVKMQFECLKKHEEQCPELENEFRQMLEMGRKQSMPGQPFPDFDLQKDFVMNECPKLPKDFTTNKCVNDKLMTSEYKDCYENATKEHTTGEDTKTMTCDAYKAAFPCVTTALETCGMKYQYGFRATTNFFLAATQEDCQLTADDTSGSASIDKMSFATILTVLFSGLKLSFV